MKRTQALELATDAGFSTASKRIAKLSAVLHRNTIEIAAVRGLAVAL